MSQVQLITYLKKKMGHVHSAFAIAKASISTCTNET